jgi:hypothetical protein
LSVDLLYYLEMMPVLVFEFRRLLKSSALTRCLYLLCMQHSNHHVRSKHHSRLYICRSRRFVTSGAGC